MTTTYLIREHGTCFIVVVLAALLVGCSFNGRQHDNDFISDELDAVDRVAKYSVGKIIVERLPDSSSLSSQSCGSGFFYRDPMYFVTSAHNLRKTESADSSYQIQFDGRSLDAVTIAVEKRVDLAILRLRKRPTSDVHALVPGTDSRRTRKVYAIGFSYPDLIQSRTPQITTGIQSPGQSSVSMRSDGITLRTCDACAGPGSSGGPVVDRSGRLLGVITAVLATDSKWNGLTGFIDVSELERLYKDTVQKNRDSEAYSR
jgi:S1-C subfamily serine protease